MNTIDIQYCNLVQDILKNGIRKKDRTGTGTVSVFGRTIRHNMSDGFPLLTTKELNFKNIWTELVWFLNGGTNVSPLVLQGNNIWVGDAYKRYCTELSINDESMNEWMRDNGDGTFSIMTRRQFIEKIKNDVVFAGKWGELGPIYGFQWKRKINGGDDQITALINDLKNNPDSRRLMVNSWNVDQLSDMVLPPCHYNFQLYTRELSEEERVLLATDPSYREVPTRAISLMWNQRSVDVGLGLPYNIASYALLLIMLADELNMIPEEVIGQLGDCHIYSNHVGGLKMQCDRQPYKLPKLSVRDGIESNMEGDFILTGYEAHPHIKLELSN